MLLSFRVANHRSLRDEQQLLLTPEHPKDQPVAARLPAVTVAGIFGANASGKSNVIHALRHMSRLVTCSFREAEPGGGLQRHPFRLGGDPSEPSYFAVDILDQEHVRHTYGFAVDDHRVVEEWLTSYPLGHPRRIFARKEDAYSYGESTPRSLRQVVEITAPNVLFLSVAARSGQEVVRPIYSWFSSSMAFVFPDVRGLPFPAPVIEAALSSDDERERITTLLRAADLGIEDVGIVREEITYEPEGLEPEVQARLRTPRERARVVFSHRGDLGGSVFELSEESLGTRTLLGLAVRVTRGLRRGSTLAVDELDASLHPYLSGKVIRLFRDPKTNPAGAQLLFTSHDVSLLGRIEGSEVLARDHIWFVEKDDGGATNLYPLTEFSPRREGENRERRYLSGKYGAVPMVQEQMFIDALANREARSDAATTD